MSIRKYIPDFITSMNLLSGVIGVVFALKGRADIAFPLMLAAAVFDFCDGLCARLLGAWSELGKQLDSLADMVSFGVLPAVMLYKMCSMLSFGESVWCWIPLVIAVFSGIRLAKFNIDERQTSGFIGLPTPACAMICGAYAFCVALDPSCLPAIWACTDWFIPALSVILSILLVCEVPMFSMKLGGGHASDAVMARKRAAFVINVAVIIAIVALTHLCWAFAILIAFIVYILMNLVFAALKL